jgi:hypothetical protein
VSAGEVGVAVAVGAGVSVGRIVGVSGMGKTVGRSPHAASISPASSKATKKKIRENDIRKRPYFSEELRVFYHTKEHRT